MSVIFAYIETVDGPALVTTIVLAVIGCVLWVAGRRILRGSFALLGLAAGGVLGLGLATAFNVGVPGWIAAVLLGLLGAMVATVAYRAILAGALAAILGTALPLCVWTVLDVQQYLDEQARSQSPELTFQWDDDAEAESAATRSQDSPDNRTDDDRSNREFDVSWIFEGLERLGQDPTSYGMRPDQGSSPELIAPEEKPRTSLDPSDMIADEMQRAGRSRLSDTAETLGLDREKFDQSLSDTGDFLSQLRARFIHVWQHTPGNVQNALLASAALGAVMGLLLGLAAPGMAAAGVTAAGGSMLWLTMLIGLLGQVGVPLHGWVPNRPMQWIAIWTIATVIGLWIQWTIARKRTDKSQKRFSR